MGARGSKPAGEAVSAAVVQARRQAVARATQPQGPPPGVTIEGTGPSSNPVPSPPLTPPSSSAAAAAPPKYPRRSGTTQLETDDALIKIMNELGPAIKTTRLETPRKDMNKLMFAHQEKAHTLPEETLAAILRSRRDMPDKFDLGQVCERYGLKEKEMEKVMAALEVPRVVERKGDKYGYWE